MRLLGNRVLVSDVEDPNLTFTRGSIVIPDAMARQTAWGKIELVGSGTKIPAGLEVGQIVRINTGMGSVTMPYQGKTCRVVSVHDVQLQLVDAA